MKLNLTELDTPDVGNVTLDINKVKENVPSFTSVKLCEMIVCNRYFGCFEDVALICMEELAKRRAAGDDFNFEANINDTFSTLPKLDFNVPNIREILQRASTTRK